MSRSLLKIVLPLALLGAGIAGAVLLVRAKPVAVTAEPERAPLLVRTVTTALAPFHLTVRSQGTVLPRTEATLVSEVAGRIVAVAASFVPGGFFETEDVLVSLDRREYELAVTRARAEVARAELRLAQERAEADLARAEWEELGRGEGAPLVAREPQLAEAQAGVAAAEAALAQAELNLSRASVRAPFAGRIREKQVDIGQFVTPGQPLARLYAVDYAEIRLPVADAELAFLDLPLAYRGAGPDARGPSVAIRARFAGRLHEWDGRIVRTEGEIDPRTRMVTLVARVDDPYGRSADRDRPPLAVGMFVDAEIAGRRLDAVVTLPRAALREGGASPRVLVVDADDRLRFRPIEILREAGDEVLVGRGLEAGERVCVSPLDTPVDGMPVRAVEDADVTGVRGEGP